MFKFPRVIFSALLFLAVANAKAAVFVAVYTDPSNGLKWSKALPSFYTNGCIGFGGKYDASECTSVMVAGGGLQVKVEDSDAARACRLIGAMLPTKEEYESLIRNFDKTEESHGPKLTAKGKSDMNAIFGDGGYIFWSASVSENFPEVAFKFDSDFGAVGIGLRYLGGSTVRCVSAH